MTRSLSLSILAALALAGPVWAQAPASGEPEQAPAAELPADAEGLGDGVFLRFQTNRGVIFVQLAYKRVPHTSANMVGLVEGTIAWTDPKTGEKVKRPYYDGLAFHRIIDGFMIQGGCPLGNGTGGPGYQFMDEFPGGDANKLPDDLKHTTPGTLSMANSGPATNGSQFFLTLAATPWLDGRHTVFGRVVKGLEELLLIGKSKTGAQDRPLEAVTIEKATVLRIGAEAQAWDPAAKNVPDVEGEADPARVPNADAPEQAEIGVKLICVMFAGCERAWPEITRTKDEAVAIAARIAAHARLPGASMDDLSTRFSDLPPMVFQLGKGKTDPSFDPAFTLEKGQVSEPFETPFGIMIAEGQ